MKKRIVCLMIALVLIVSIGVGSIAVSAQESNNKNLDIAACNLSFSDTVYIKYAVPCSDNDLSLLIWTQPQTAYEAGTESCSITASEIATINDAQYTVFVYKELAAKQMTDVIYARVYDGNGHYGDVVKYSVLQYAYNMLGKTGTGSSNENLKNLLNQMLAYGAAAQTYFEYKTNEPATAEFYQIKVENGLLADQCNHGLYLPGTQVTMNAAETNENGEPFAHWANGAGVSVSANPTMTYTVGTKNETLIAVYGDVASPSDGLEFESNGDGTAVLISMGSCTDTEVVIPDHTPDGDLVTEIDNSAFAGEEITSITIPSGVTTIGRRAFNGCTELTDVYYNGTLAQWEAISIGTNNAPLLNATLHTAAAQQYAVTFVDWDGSVISVASVAEGEDATPPANPEREGYSFEQWDGEYTNVTADCTVTAKYVYQSSEPTLLVETVSAASGAKEVKLAVSVVNNPGILGMTFAVEYDSSALTLKGATNGDALSTLTYTKPSRYRSGSIFSWYGENISESDIRDGACLILEFEVSEAANGDYPIRLTGYNESIFDRDLSQISMTAVDGYIRVSQ